MLVIVGDRIRAGVRKGQTLAQVKAARPTLDYDGRWGRTPGDTDRFVEGVYGEVAGQR
jgi:hypothetical protein